MSAPIVLCSICSREKSELSGALPARLRYRGSHIATAATRAQEMGWPLYILSGVHGFISENELIEYYDRLLVATEVPELVLKIIVQLRATGVQEIHFCTKTKPQWQPYRDALERATRVLQIKLLIHELAPDV